VVRAAEPDARLLDVGEIRAGAATTRAKNGIVPVGLRLPAAKPARMIPQNKVSGDREGAMRDRTAPRRGLVVDDNVDT
jgi:hypothetical protein